MSKTIEEAAREYAKENSWSVLGEGIQLSCIEGADSDFAGHLVEFAKEILTHQWRSVEDELPEDGDVVLAKIAETADEHKFIQYSIACYIEGYWSLQDTYFDDCTVSHWLPIPSLNPEQR